jgi:translation elongation factor EF-4
MDVIMTSPQVTYKIKFTGDKSSEYTRFTPEVCNTGGSTFTYIYISNPEDLPPREKYISIEEPIAKVEIITPSEYV